MKSKYVLFGFVLVALVVAACTPQGPIPQSGGSDDITTGLFVPGEEITTEQFGSVAELSAFLEGYQTNYYGGMLKRSQTVGAEMVESVAVDSAMPVATGGSGSSGDYSETNVQVAGVDEGDIIKTDGEYIYTISGKTLFVVKAYPGDESEIVATIVFEKGTPNGMFIADDQLVVFGRVSDYGLFDDLEIPSRTSMTFFDVYDVSDKEDVELVKEFVFEGDYFESRMMDGHVYLVTQQYPDIRPRPMPFLIEDDVVREVGVDTIKYFPVPYDSVSFVTVNAVALDNLDHVSETLAVEGSRELYMSHNNMYLSYTKRVNEWDITQDVTMDLIVPLLSAADQALIDKIEAVDAAILSQHEKEQKVMSVVEKYVEFLPRDEREVLREEVELKVKDELEQYDYFEYTIIHKVAVDGLDVEVVAHGEVPGHLNNQFSMDEQVDVLRVATTVNRHWSSYKELNSESTNLVLTLDEDLDELDRLDNIAESESIYSTRFMGDKLYMVTFRQVDPFFVIDLSDPENIASLGELKIPGFSRYLHPYDENHIIGLGRDASETGRQQGLKISIFDVSDVSNPKEVAQWESTKKYSSSIAEYEHKAFLFSKEKNLLVIPAYYNDWQDDLENYNGALVFNITADDIEVRGLIDHADGAKYNYGSAVERSLYIDDLLYTKSYGLLRINNLDDLSSVNTIELEQGASGDIPVY